MAALSPPDCVRKLRQTQRLIFLGRAALPAPIAIGLIVTIGVTVIIIIAATRSTRRGRSHETESRSSNGGSGVVATIAPVIAMMPVIVDVPPVVANLLDLRG